jgi:hypothetical protein
MPGDFGIRTSRVIRSTRTQLLLLIAGWLVAALLALTVYRARQIDALLAPGRLHANDFKHLWIGARLLDLGQSPYDPQLLFAMAEAHHLGGINPYVYLPFTGLQLAPIARLPFDRAARLWFWLNHLFLGLAIAATALHAAWSRHRWASGWLAAFGVLVAAFMMPLSRQMTAGQLNCALVLALVVILISVERRLSVLAGLAIAWATLFKLSPGLFVLYLLWKRAWRLIGWTALWLAILVGWSLWRVGLDIHLQFLPLLADMRIGHSTWAQQGMYYHCDPANQAVGSFLLHIFASRNAWNLIELARDPAFVPTAPWIDLGPSVANALTALFALGVLGVLVFVTRRGWGRGGPSADAWRAEWSLLVIASLLIPSLMWDHCAVQLLPILMLGIWGSFTLARPPARVLALLGWLAAAVLLAVPVNHWSPALRHGLGLVVMSVRLWGVLLMFGLAVWWRFSLNHGEREE